MYTLNGWWFLSSGGSYPPVFTVDKLTRLELHLATIQEDACSSIVSLLPQDGE